MAAIASAYTALAGGYATPTQLGQINLAEKSLATLDQILDMDNPVNRRKVRIMGENFARNYLAEGTDGEFEAVLEYCYVDDSASTHWELCDWLCQLGTKPK